MSEHTEARTRVVTEEETVHVCDLCDCKIDGEPVRVAVQPKARLEVADVPETRKQVSAYVTPNHPEDHVGALHRARGTLFMEVEQSGDLCRYCADNLGLGGTDGE